MSTSELFENDFSVQENKQESRRAIEQSAGGRDGGCFVDGMWQR